ncbi:cupin domain-containing protein [Lentzea sp. NPDC051213]|uniref:cupin domain-containing protein n=1 Tax=Lentzea sp. NPDC051213 TaxID=3364126 RepID=UPI00379A7115
MANVGDGPEFDYYATSFEQVLPEDATGGALTVIRNTVLPGNAPPIHVHTREDEFWVVLEGVVRIWIGGTTLEECESWDVEAGGFAFAPRGLPHTFDTVTDSAKVLIGALPGALEKYFQSVGRAEGRKDEENLALLTSFGAAAVGAPPNLHAAQVVELARD